MEKTIEILKQRTLNLFNEEWYNSTASEIHSTNTKEGFGYIYIVRVGKTKKCKIGFSTNIIKRINSFKTTLGNNLILDGFIYCKNYSELEKEIHSKLVQYRIHGEWFNLTFELSEKIINDLSGTITLSNIDSELIITDGIFISGSKNTRIVKNENMANSNKFFLEKIHHFMREKNITILQSTPKELFQFLFHTESDYSSKIVSRQLKYIGLKSSEFIKRYKSDFDGESKVGNTYIINLPTEQ